MASEPKDSNNTNGSHGYDSLYTVPLLIDGKEVITETTFPVISPTSHRQLWHCSSATLSHVTAACTAASAALSSWSLTKPSTKRNIFLRAASLIESRAEELAGYMREETGAGKEFANGFNVPGAVEMLRDVAGRVGAGAGAGGGRIEVCEEVGRSAVVVREAVGVVLGVAPWNAPYILGLRAVLYPLAAGCTTILKVSELSPRTAWALGSILTAAGLPPGALNILFHRPEDAAQITTALIEHPAVRKINFTGSTNVGRIIATQAGKALKPVLLELGGKASAIVLDDADVGLAAEQCALGAFLHAGQICMSSERVVVQRGVKEEFMVAFKAAVDKIFGGENEALVVAAESAVMRNKRLIRDAVAAGAKVVHGDHEREEMHPDTGEVSGTRMRPVIVDGVTSKMELFYTESFGPSVSVVEVESEEEAVRVANDTEYGLSGAVFTRDLARGLRIAKQIETGAVHINSMTVHDEFALAHGGAKSSGFGRFNGNWGIEEFTRLKTITYKD